MNRRPTIHQPRDREALLARLDRLLWVMESVATDGWSKPLIPRHSTGYQTSPTGDDVVARWLQTLTHRLDIEIDRYLDKLDTREDKIAGVTQEIQNALRRDTRDAMNRTADNRCPNCGTSTRSAGAF